MWTKAGWLYLCCVLDLFNREIVGWSMKEKMTEDIVLDALRMAKLRCRPPSGIIFHSNRGSQYASRATQNWLKAQKNAAIHVRNRQLLRQCTNRKLLAFLEGGTCS
ncbi:DDE-type integrase/transposase/recombinase [Nitrosomonas communis]|uniref:DDE-type integrase/transposase/recombinase n=1 Tax=Nitrosomonas communis TaxID=44574 RepID=UPI0034E9673E